MEYGTIEHKRHFLATVVMGWVTDVRCKVETYWNHLGIVPVHMFDVDDFKPDINIKQSLMLLDQFSDTQLTRSKSDFGCVIYTEELVFKENGTREEAIIEAVLTTKGYYK